MRALLTGVLLTGAAMTAMPAEAAGDAFATAATLHRGMNIIGYDPLWSDPAKARFKPKHFATIRRGGFDFVRVVLQAFGHMDARNRLDPHWLATLDRVIDQATAAGLTVILDEHDFNLCAEDAAACAPKLDAFWSQIGERYKDRPKTVLFELLNEPHDQLNGETWNRLLAATLATVRRSNPDRTVIVGPTHWNSLNDLPSLKLPEGDRNIIVTFHYYEPFRFTHQGAPWTDNKALSGVTWGTPADKGAVKADFDKVASWAQANRRPVLLGEFGAFDKSGTPMALRVDYTASVARTAEAEGFSWAYWQFDSDFIAYDLDRDRWIEPIRQALVP